MMRRTGIDLQITRDTTEITDTNDNRGQCKPLEVLPVDTASRLLLVRLHARHSRHAGLHLLQHRGMIDILNLVILVQEPGLGCSDGIQGRYALRGKRRGDTIAEY